MKCFFFPAHFSQQWHHPTHTHTHKVLLCHTTNCRRKSFVFWGGNKIFLNVALLLKIGDIIRHVNFSWKKWDFSGGGRVLWRGLVIVVFAIKRGKKKNAAHGGENTWKWWVFERAGGESSLVQLAFHYTVCRRIWNSAPLAIYFRFRKKQKKSRFWWEWKKEMGKCCWGAKKNKHTKQFGQSKLDLGGNPVKIFSTGFFIISLLISR